MVIYIEAISPRSTLSLSRRHSFPIILNCPIHWETTVKRDKLDRMVFKLLEHNTGKPNYSGASTGEGNHKTREEEKEKPRTNMDMNVNSPAWYAICAARSAGQFCSSAK